MEPETGGKPEKQILIYNKACENLIEICLVYASLQAGNEKLSDTDSITWKQMFVGWANEFEVIYADTDWDQNDYLEEIEKFAQQKILKYAELDDSLAI